jgi:hypothetical protein
VGRSPFVVGFALVLVSTVIYVSAIGAGVKSVTDANNAVHHLTPIGYLMRRKPRGRGSRRTGCGQAWAITKSSSVWVTVSPAALSSRGSVVTETVR